MASVLVIEDDDRIRLALHLALEDEGYTVSGAASAEDGLAAQRTSPADTVLVDLMLPGLDGFDCIRQLRRSDDVPIVVISARTDTHDIVAALEAGADDYLVKPVAIKELSARLRALRRRGRNEVPAMPILVVGDLEIRPLAGEVRLRGDLVALTRTEFRLLCELAEHTGLALSRQQLLSRVWEYDFGDERLVDVHVGRLRQKIEDEPARDVVMAHALHCQDVPLARAQSCWSQARNASSSSLIESADVEPTGSRRAAADERTSSDHSVRSWSICSFPGEVRMGLGGKSQA